jgi:type I restriction enzyme S subunit
LEDEALIPLPPLPEQQRIAAILDKADRLRRLRQYALDLGETYLQSVFLEMFGDQRQFSQMEFGDLLSDDPKNGLYLPAEKYGRGTPIIRITEFYDGELGNPDDFKRVEASQQEIDEFCVQNGEILINRVNSLEYLGKCAFVEGLREPTLFESNMMRIRVDTSKALPIFLTKFLSSKQAYVQIMRCAKKAVNQASINQTDVKSLVVPVPPLPLQEKFAGVVRQYDRLRAQQRESLRQAEMLFGALLEGSFHPHP